MPRVLGRVYGQRAEVIRKEADDQTYGAWTTYQAAWPLSLQALPHAALPTSALQASSMLRSSSQAFQNSVQIFP